MEQAPPHTGTRILRTCSGDAPTVHADAAETSSKPTRFIKGTTIEKPPNNDVSGLHGILMHPLSILLVCLPIGVLGSYHDWSDSAVFVLNFIALIPLAKILGDATEELAAGLQNDMLAGLLNASFGNAVEIVMMIQTLRAGLLQVVKATLLGSVLSNLLLVLGMSFFCGGILSKHKQKPLRKPFSVNGSNAGVYVSNSYGSHTGVHVSNNMGVGGANAEYKYIQAAGESLGPEAVISIQPPKLDEYEEIVQKFSVLAALVNTSMLLLACLCLSLVAVFASETEERSHDGRKDEIVLMVSRVCSIVMIVAYVAYIFFQLVTHREAMAEDDDGDGESATISIPTAIFVMLVTTVVVAYSSDLLIQSLEGVVQHSHISEHFIGIILLPIVGNACEHASAVRFAILDKPGLSLGIAIGSSTQISMFVIPCSVLAGWAMNRNSDLNFGQLNTIVLCVSIVVVLSIVVDGMTNWLQGYLLISAYIVVAVLYFWLPDTFDPEAVLTA